MSIKIYTEKRINKLLRKIWNNMKDGKQSTFLQYNNLREVILKDYYGV